MQRLLRSVIPAICLCGLLIASAWGGAPARRQQKPTPPATPKPTSQPNFEPYLPAARKAIDTATLPAFATSLEEELRKSIADVNVIDLPHLIALESFREFGRYFGKLGTLDATQKQTLQWLVVQAKLFPLLMSAVSEDDAPKDVLTVLAGLLRDSGNRLSEFPDLTTALCVVWDSPQEPRANRPETAASKTPPARKPPDVARAIKRFRQYTDSKIRLPYDPKVLPWQLSIYMIDSPISDDEIAWAIRMYSNRRVISKIYFEVPYDMAAFRAGKRKIDGDQYTLPNIRQFGGVCLDQAYFAAQACKSLGVPSAICSGQSGNEGELHAWFGFLQPAGNAASWNFNEARYAAMLFWSGKVNDPQGGPALTDAEVCLCAELTATPADKRTASVMLYKSRDLVTEDKSPDLFMRSIDLSPGNRLAWMGLAALGADKNLSIAQIDRVTSVVQRFAVERYPDFAFAVYRKIIAGRNVDEQLVAMSSITKQFSLRPDLVATVEIAKGDLLRDAKRENAALAAYQQAMTDPTRIGLVLPEALARADALLRASNEKPKLATIYRAVWARTPTPQPSGYADLTPFCTIGHKYAKLLREIGDLSNATTIERRVQQVEGKKG